MELTVHPSSKLFPPMPRGEIKALAADIKKNGLLEPIVVHGEQIVDGKNRYAACREAKVKIVVRELLPKKDPLEVAISLNLRRRNLNAFQKAEVGYELHKQEAEKAKQRQLACLNNGKRLSLASNGANGQNGKTNECIAAKVGLTPKTYERAKKIIECATDKIKAKLRTGEMRIYTAFSLINRGQKHRNTPSLPKGQYDVIYADPPWSYEERAKGSPSGHRPTKVYEEIKKLLVPSAKNAVLFLWVPAPKLEVGFAVLKAWGFKFTTVAAWEKNGNGHLLQGIKGKIPTPLPRNKVSSVVKAARGKHSQKPQKVYSIIEKMYPNRKYFEMFAGNKRKGWNRCRRGAKPKKAFLADSSEVSVNNMWRRLGYPQ